MKTRSLFADGGEYGCKKNRCRIVDHFKSEEPVDLLRPVMLLYRERSERVNRTGNTGRKFLHARRRDKRIARPHKKFIPQHFTDLRKPV